MLTPVAAVNTPRLVALGLSTELEEWGFTVESVEDPCQWARSHTDDALLVTVRSQEDADFLGQLISESPSSPVVALLDPGSMEQMYSCLAAGARGCVSMESSSQDVALALKVGLRGMTIMPATVARRLAGTVNERPLARTLTNTQQAWLRDLASGTTVHSLATRVGFSEREMYRRLRQVYRAIGCTTRTEALIRASAFGMLDHPPAAGRA